LGSAGDRYLGREYVLRSCTFEVEPCKLVKWKNNRRSTQYPTKPKETATVLASGVATTQPPKKQNRQQLVVARPPPEATRVCAVQRAADQHMRALPTRRQKPLPSLRCPGGVARPHGTPRTSAGAAANCPLLGTAPLTSGRARSRARPKRGLAVARWRGRGREGLLRLADRQAAAVRPSPRLPVAVARRRRGRKSKRTESWRHRRRVLIVLFVLPRPPPCICP
jgi:hypothetical protein